MACPGLKGYLIFLRVYMKVNKNISTLFDFINKANKPLTSKSIQNNDCNKCCKGCKNK